MIIAVNQESFGIGNIKTNFKKICHFIEDAKAKKSDLVVFPQYAITGIPIDGLFSFPSFVEECEGYLEKLLPLSRKIGILINLPVREQDILYDRMMFLHQGKVKHFHDHICLDRCVFPEVTKYFSNGASYDMHPVTFNGEKICFLFEDELSACADISKKADLIICMGAKPCSHQNYLTHKTYLSDFAKKQHVRLLYVNASGGFGQFVFEGESKFINNEGKLIKILRSFEDDFDFWDSQGVSLSSHIPLSNIEYIHDTLVVAIREYFRRNNFKTAIIGLSGGIDSAIVLALTTKALKHNHVRVLLLPSLYSSTHSVDDALQMAQLFRVEHDIISIKPLFKQYLTDLKPLFNNLPFDLTEENLQARIRGGLLMGIANKFHGLVLNTSNKSEMAVGYGTLYGDMVGGLSVLGDLYKTQVYELARFINRKREWIPENIIRKAPSAELRPDQKDSDSLPDYEILDKLLFDMIEKRHNQSQLVALGYDKEMVDRIWKLVQCSEYKRRQAPPVISLGDHTFGQGFKFPLISEWR